MNVFRMLCVVVVAAGCGAPNVPWDEALATQRLPVVLISQSPEANVLPLIERAVTEHPDARLIALGELSTGLYWKGFDANYQRTVAQPLDGEFVTSVRALAVQHHVFIAVGFAELSEGSIFNSAVVIDDRGELVAHKRKSNFVPMDEAGGFTKGERQVPTFLIDGVKSALLICNDFNDATLRDQITADPDVRLVVLPQASAGLKPETVERSPYPFTRAWMLAPQRRGDEGLDRYLGSWVVDPNGAVPARASDELLFAELRFVPATGE